MKTKMISEATLIGVPNLPKLNFDGGNGLPVIRRQVTQPIETM